MLDLVLSKEVSFKLVCLNSRILEVYMCVCGCVCVPLLSAFFVFAFSRQFYSVTWLKVSSCFSLFFCLPYFCQTMVIVLKCGIYMTLKKQKKTTNKQTNKQHLLPCLSTHIPLLWQTSCFQDIFSFVSMIC